MIYRRYGLCKVDRAHRVKTWGQIYREHARSLFLWGAGFLLLFGILFYTLVRLAVKVVME